MQPPKGSNPSTATSASRRRARALAGPVLILAVVLVILRDFAFGGTASPEDLIRYWLPTFDFLGRSLRAGHIPAWNPFVLSGTPFAADPQSGWMYVTPMVLFTALPARVAIRWTVIVQPMLAGLGLYAFMRAEGASRTAATIAGLVLSVPMASSELAVTVRFPGALAWTAITLAAAARYVRADRTSRRLGWLTATTLAWGQVAAAHLSIGLAVSTLALAAYVIGHAVQRLRAREWAWRSEIGRGLSLLVAFPLVNLAYFLPRLALTPATSLGVGYHRLNSLSLQLQGTSLTPFPGPGAGASWPLNLATVPGRYLGAAGLLLFAAGLWSRRWRQLVVALGSFGVLTYLAGLTTVTSRIPPSLYRVTAVDQYLHRPYTISMGVLLGMGVLAGCGVEAWREQHSRRERFLMLLPALVLWVAVPIVEGATLRNLSILLIGGVATGAILAWSTQRPVHLAVLPIVLAGEAIVASFLTVSGPALVPQMKLLDHQKEAHFAPSLYLNRPRLGEAVARRDGCRYVSLGPATDRVLVEIQSLQDNESMVYGIENVGGYQAEQLERYWLLLRTLIRAPTPYNYALFPTAPPVARDLLCIRWIVAPTSHSPEAGAIPVVVDGSWTLYEAPTAPRRATVVSAWMVVQTPDRALAAVTRPGFDPSRAAVLERAPGIRGSTEGGTGATAAGSGAATYRPVGLQGAVVEVQAARPSIVLVRNTWDANWRASIDGKPVPVLAADYVDQGVAVPAGRHTIVLSYHDPTIGLGLLGSGVSLALLGAAAAVAGRRAHVAARSEVSAPPTGATARSAGPP